MLNTMINSSVTMGQLQHKMDTIANNMANVDTAGFKRKEVSFKELLYQQYNNQPKEGEEVGRLTPLGVRQGVGAALAQASLMMEQGSIKQTDRALDVSILNENQFFHVASNEDGASLTRDGKFYLSPSPDADNGQPGSYLVTGNGDFVQGRDGDIVFPEGTRNVVISETGEVTATNANGENIIIAQLDVVNVSKPQLLNAVGGNKFQLPENLGELGFEIADVLEQANVEEISVKQGALEMSNVDMGKEMSELMMAQRSYQFNAQSLRMSNDMFGLINQLR